MRIVLLSFLRAFSYLFLLLVCITNSVGGQTGTRILEYNTKIKINKGIKEEIRSYIIEVTDKESEWITNIQIPFKKANKPEILEACIINREGTEIRKLNKKEIITRSDISTGTFFDDNLVYEFSLRHNEYPYLIKYSYKINSDNYISLTRWTPMMFPNVFTESAVLEVELPYNYQVRINAKGNYKTKVDSLEKTYRQSWQFKEIKPVKKELFMPSLTEVLPFVNIDQINFNYVLPGSIKTWGSFGMWIEKLNSGLTTLPLSEQNNVNVILDGLKKESDKIKTLYYYLQDNCRYINVSIEAGGLKPYPASYVSANRYGDCKALTIFMKALLEHAGIRSYYTVINAGTNEGYVNVEFPGQQFNHVILCIPLESDTVWLENTSQYLPYNELGTFTQNRYGLLVNGEKSALVKTPKVGIEDLLEINSYRFSLNIEGTGTGSVHRVLSGEDFLKYLYIKHELSDNDQKEEIENDLDLNNAEINSWNINRISRDMETVNLDLELSVKNQLRRIGSSLVLSPVRMRLYSLQIPGKRENRVKINYPINSRDSVRYDLSFAGNYNMILPGDIKIETKYGIFKVSYYKEENQVFFLRIFQLYSGEYSLEEYPDFYNFLEDIKKSIKESNIIFNKL